MHVACLCTRAVQQLRSHAHAAVQLLPPQLRLLQHPWHHSLPQHGHQHHQQQGLRGASTQQAAPPLQQLTLKAALRQLYKRVHPDLFTDYPAEQAENERSFKLLQDYLHQARNPSTGPASRTAFHFRFFMAPGAGSCAAHAPDDDCGSSGPTAGDAAASPQFELVQLVLVPPPPPPSRPSSSSGDGPQQGAGVLSPAARAGLRKLLGMCGLVLPEGDEGEEAADSALKLTTFLPQAAEVVRQHESGPARHEVRVANLRAAFRLAHRVIAGFTPGAFAGQEQVQLLQRLARAFDRLSDDPPDLAGLHILICHKTALDAQGTLCLDAGAGAEEWAGFLGGVDPDWARDRAASAAALRQLEGDVAGAVGVRMLFTAAPYLMTHEYRCFLERLAAHAAQHGAVHVGASASSSASSKAPSGGDRPATAAIPVYVAPGCQLSQHHQQQQQQQVVHEVVGFIQVPMAAPAQQVYSMIQAHAAQALRVLSRKAAQQQELAELTACVRTRLNLRHLLRDELVGLDAFRSCCKRLLYHRDLLLRCGIEGLSLRVSDGNRVAPDGSLVNIAWDFDM